METRCKLNLGHAIYVIWSICYNARSVFMFINTSKLTLGAHRLLLLWEVNIVIMRLDVKFKRLHLLLNPSSTVAILKTVYAVWMEIVSNLHGFDLSLKLSGSKSTQYQVQWYNSRSQVYMENWGPPWTFQGQWYQLCKDCSKFCCEVF